MWEATVEILQLIQVIFDILIELPSSYFDRFNNLSGNGQSRLLQAVRNAILCTYPRSNIHADGQVVKIAFSDEIYFEIVPAFKNELWPGCWDGTYKYPDSNLGGRWKSTKSKSLSKKLWLKKIEIVMVYYMILVDIFATLEIIILQVTNYLVLLLIVLFTTQLEIGDG